MPREEIETYISHACAIRVRGKRTETEGRFRGIGVTEDGKPSIVLDVIGAPLPFAYRLEEVRRIDYLSPATTGQVAVEIIGSPPEGSYRLVDYERVDAALQRQAKETGGVIPTFVRDALDEAFGVSS